MAEETEIEEAEEVTPAPAKKAPAKKKAPAVKEPAAEVVDETITVVPETSVAESRALGECITLASLGTLLTGIPTTFHRTCTNTCVRTATSTTPSEVNHVLHGPQ